MFNNIKGIIKFEAIAPDTNYFINLLKKSCITANNIQYKNEKITGSIYRKDFIELKKLGEKCNAQISILEKRGAIFTVQKYKKRAGLLIGFLMSLFLVMYMSDLVMIIDIYGNTTITDKQILSLLNDNGIHIGTHISEINLRTAERKILSSSDKISWIGIRAKGSKLQVEINEMDNSPEIIPMNIPCNIVSSKDAQITEIRNVYSGMLVQMLNNGVKKGDLLISGVVENGKGGTYYSHSIGEIIGKYTEKIEFVQPYSDKEICFSDTITQKHLNFFGLKIPLSFIKNDFELYEYDEDITYLQLYDLQFPIGIIYSKYKPYTISEINYSPEQAKAILMDKINMYELNFLKKDDIKILNKEIEFKETEEGMCAATTFTLEGNIGVSKEIIIK